MKTDVQVVTPTNLINSIYELIEHILRLEKTHVNRKNPLRLGHTKFWLEFDSNQNLFLVYDTNPKEWTEQQIEDIKHFLHEREYNLFQRYQVVQ